MEHIIYSHEEGTYVAPPPIMPHNNGKPGNRISKALAKISRFLAYLGILLLVVAYAPSVFFWVQSIGFGVSDNFKLNNSEVKTLQLSTNQLPDYLPPYDPKLPSDNHLTIKAIGVNTTIQEATYDNYEKALKNGVWRVSDFGAPGKSGKPTILAAHRYGYLAWTNSFRHLNSFYNLPKLKEGDLVEISWQKRKYTFEIYASDKGEAITDYTADLILYTCETLNGPIRIFKYARLIRT